MIPYIFEKTSFYPDTFWLGLKPQVGNNIRFLEVVLPLSSLGISITGGMLLFTSLVGLCLACPGVYPLCSVGSFHLATRLPLCRYPFLLISSSMLLTFIFMCVFIFLFSKQHFSASWVSVVVTAVSVPRLRLASFQASASFSWSLVPQVSGNPWQLTITMACRWTFFRVLCRFSEANGIWL